MESHLQGTLSLLRAPPSETKATVTWAGFQAAGHKSLEGYSEVSRPEMGLNGGSGSLDPGQTWESAFPPAPR